MNGWIARWATCALTLTAGCAGCGDEGLVRDGGGDVGADVFVSDSARDTRPDVIMEGFPESDLGGPCNPTRGCRASPTCIGETRTELGGPSDPLVGCADGVESVAVTSFEDGYCSNVAPVDDGGCDPADEDSCGGSDYATCLSTGQTSPSGSPITLCAASCRPSLTDNPCRDGYECTLSQGACLPGCRTDLECQVRRADTNGDGRIDVFDATDNPDGDHLKCETEVRAWCDTATSRCRHEGTPGARAGDACTDDFECEADGDCLADNGLEGGFAGGYCIKRGCDLAGNECAGDGTCHARAFGFPVCLGPCEVAATETGDDPFSPSRDCRPGYTCFWDGASGAGPNNGGCIPENRTEVRVSNVGDACADETDCYSPFGLGRCRDFGAGNHCTFFDCGAPGMPADVCGDGAVCAQVSGSVTSLCIATCDSADDCLAGNGCWDTSVAGIGTGGDTVCFPGCLEDGHCRATETCVGATMTMVGRCEE